MPDAIIFAHSHSLSALCQSIDLLREILSENENKRKYNTLLR